MLCKRRGQTEGVQTSIISFGANRLVPNIDRKMVAKSKSGKPDSKTIATLNVAKEKLIETLRTISAGKMMVEVIRANLTKMLADMKEKEGNVKEAARIIQEETPETYTTMERREKAVYLLEQVRLCLATKDYVRANILAKKVDRAKLDQFQDLKIKLHNLLIEYYTHERDPLELARSHLAIYKTNPSSPTWANDLKSCLIYLAASPFSNDQVDLIHNILNDKSTKERLKQLPLFKSFVEHFITDEIAQWPLPEHNDALRKEPVLKAGEEAFERKKKTSKSSKFAMVDLVPDDDSWVFRMLYDRVIEHDIRVVSKYYTQIYTDRLAEMLQLDVNQTESYVSQMVSNDSNSFLRLVAKIDRPEGIIDFSKRMSPDNILAEWAGNVGELLNLVEKTCHLIHKENMVHQINEKEKAKQALVS